MARYKNTLDLKQLEAHVIDWFVDRVHEQRMLVNEIIKDKSIPEEEALLILSGFADSLEDIKDLVYPIQHDEIDLIEWIDDFMDKYQRSYIEN